MTIYIIARRKHINSTELILDIGSRFFTDKAKAEEYLSNSAPPNYSIFSFTIAAEQ